MGEILGISIQSDKEVAGANRVPVSNQENAQNIVTKLDSIQNAADKSSFDELTEEDKKKINEFLSSISNHSQYIKELGTITINVTKENYVSVQDLINRTTQTFAYIMQKRNLIESNQQKKLEPVNIKNDLHQKAAQKKAEQEKAAEVFADKVKTRTDYAQAVKEARTAADRIQTPVKTNHNEARHVIKA